MPVQSVHHVGDKLVVGQIDYSFIPLVPTIPGTGVLNGPVWIGAGVPGVPQANCMIGPGIGQPISLQIIGIANHYGVYNRFAISNVTGLTSKVGTTLRAALSGTTGVNVKSALNAGSALNTFKTIVCDTTCTAARFIGDISTTTGLNPQMITELNQAKALPAKSFDIKHPSKEGHRLRYVSLEGPEVGVYFRGKSKSNVIDLPDYWKDLVHEESITVNLTSVGQYQNLYVESIKDNKIYVGGGVVIQGQTHFNYHYTVFAERKDLDKLIVEYEGETAKDYPGQDYLGLNK